MGVTARLARFAARRPRVHLVTALGGTPARLSTEVVLRRRGWPIVASPTAAGLLVVCGEPDAVVERACATVWDDLPSPRGRAVIPPDAPSERITTLLDEAAMTLGDADLQRVDALDHPMTPFEPAMADRGPDRDGLRLDRLHVPLGPVLAHWPAGLVVRTTLQGDVIEEAEIPSRLPTGTDGGSFWDEPWRRSAAGETVSRGAAERRRAAAHLDGLARFLSLAGWEAAAGPARRLRDGLLAEAPAGEVGPRIRRLCRRVGRSRVLSWMTRGLGVIDEEPVARYGLVGPAARHPGDVAARIHGWLEEIEAAVARLDDEEALDDLEGPRGPVDQRPSAGLVEVLPAVVTGAELAGARLIVASLDPDLDQLAVEVARV
ncbi:hypothetical protein [Thermomonospora umbrina]|uniref:Uncharacterized protein n=1 Tax=Thermomonospora umbrina TaxID=111806 RepID=A0A3D9SV92_9ACTN|nr:hypothetical protein [Thermomonospora umbrina]REE99872.1 hypothetical protein DFJ69_5389 [Thermomonospora umbrina]